MRILPDAPGSTARPAIVSSNSQNKVSKNVTVKAVISYKLQQKNALDGCLKQRISDIKETYFSNFNKFIKYPEILVIYILPCSTLAQYIRTLCFK